MDTSLDRLVQAVQAGAKYRRIAPNLVRTIAARELAAHRKFDAAVKATRGKLHQIAGVYQASRTDYPGWLALLRSAAAESGEGETLRRPAVQRACRSILAQHTSTKERLPIIETFFATTLADVATSPLLTAPPFTILDLGCGLNPLALPWMPFAPQTIQYVACDIYEDQAAFLGEALAILGIAGTALTADLSDPQAVTALPQADLALALKLLPVLEQIERGAALRLLQLLPAGQILVSFPGHSLGGRKRGMPAHYEQIFLEMIAGQPWNIRRFAWREEPAFLIHKPGNAEHINAGL
jgi:16S rRNA (guanine(1405)-N(7))-methyltransferase